MSAELLKTLSLGSFGIAIALLVITVVLFFALDIRTVYGELSGRTAQKAIEEIRRKNEEGGTKAYKPSRVNAARGKLTDKISPSGNLISRTDDLNGDIGTGTEKIPTGTLYPFMNETMVLQGNETTVLQSAETTVLTGNETTVLQHAETTQLMSQNNETTVLMAPELTTEQEPLSQDNCIQGGNGDFSMDVDMSYTGSSELIE